ncbi:MAG: bifunctional nuclease domain-containing protein [Chloroflexota bacterium]
MITDASLVQACLAGDKAAFSQLAQRHWERVRRVLLAAGVAVPSADDLLQEAFLEAFLNLDKLRDPTKFRAWVCGIGLNLAKMQWRQASKRPFQWHSLESMTDSLVDKRPLPEQQASEHETRRRLQQAIADLPPAEQEAILLVYRDGLSQRETAVSLGVSLSAVKVRVHRGRRRLRQLLTESPVGAMEVPMIEVVVQDMVKLFKTEEEVETDKGHHVVILQEKTGERQLPIWIGPCEAGLITVQVQGVEMERPLNYDLMKALLDVGQMQVKRAVVSKLHGKIFYGTLEVQTADGQQTDVDCRPSDAIVLALRLDIPIFVAPEVMETAGSTRAELQTKSITELASVLMVDDYSS